MTYHCVLGITSYNRLFYLRKCIETFLKTKATGFQWTLIVADDGSTDGSVEYVKKLKPADCNVILIYNGKRSISYQTNTIFKMSEIIKFDYLFKSDDDMMFTAPGWDVNYIEAIEKTGMDHLIFLEPSYHFKNKTQVKHIHASRLLEGSLGNPISGYFFTLTPNVLKTVGYFDEVNFPHFGFEHRDYSSRCFKKNYNDDQYRYDIVNSGNALKLQSNHKMKLLYMKRALFLLSFIMFLTYYMNYLCLSKALICTFLILTSGVYFYYTLYITTKSVRPPLMKIMDKNNKNKYNILKQESNRIYVGISPIYQGTKVYFCHKITDLTINMDYFNVLVE